MVLLEHTYLSFFFKNKDSISGVFIIQSAHYQHHRFNLYKIPFLVHLQETEAKWS